MRHANVHSIYMSSAPAGVLCEACGHRGTVTAEQICGGSGQGNMESLTDVARRLKCTACNEKNVKIFTAGAEFIERWVCGLVEHNPESV